ncbi:hypothetical protein HMPREF9069_01048 [Atopobium sp. oral taxon 810 str. F0209]|nr:hypothetical protein HMPREF9069_01048 [Atopobium sp. oral taxon 810 str. F0209]
MILPSSTFQLLDMYAQLHPQYDDLDVIAHHPSIPFAPMGGFEVIIGQKAS